MKTAVWILVVFTHNLGPVSALDGYKSQLECETAAKTISYPFQTRCMKHGEVVRF